MQKKLIWKTAVLCAAWLATGAALTLPARAENRQVGIGANYWRTLDRLGSPFDREGLSWMFSYQHNLSRVLGLQADLEWFRAGFAGAQNDVFAPQGHILAGGALYAGLGTGILYSDGRFNDRHFYNLRAGLDMEILPTVHVDINANYQFSEWRKIHNLSENLRSDTIIMGAALRMEF